MAEWLQRSEEIWKIVTMAAKNKKNMYRKRKFNNYL